ncbi:MAG TPA: rod shape-determining protein MreC [Opitutaceae bacterium]|nr:rod shape-determining protein MreC [Opitutaceae bacterium]
MSPLQFIRQRPFAVLAVVAILWLLTPVALKRLAQVSLFEFGAPADFAASYARDLQQYWSLRTRTKNELLQTARDLANLNASYELRIQENESLREQVQRLEEALHLPSDAEYRTEIARVVRREFGTWSQRLVIRKGRNAGIPVGAPVVFTGGVVGRVAEVYAYTAVVDLVSSPTLRIAAMVDGDSRPFSFQGGPNPPFAQARGAVEFVPLDIYASEQAPKRIVTAGLGGVFPAGIVIGHVQSLELDTGGLFKSGAVLLDPRLNELHEVAVLVPLNPEQQ